MHPSPGAQTREPRVFELLHPQGHDHIVETAGHRHEGLDERDMPRGAPVLIPDYGDIPQLQRLGRHGPSDSDERGRGRAQKAGLNLFGSNTCILVGLVRSLDGQIVQPRIPTLAEAGASHSHNGYSVLDGSHDITPPPALACTSKNSCEIRPLHGYAETSAPRASPV